MGRPDQAHLARVATSLQADYIVGEAAPAYYDEVGLTQFTRHLLFVKGPKPYTVAFDQLAAKSPQTWTSYLHTFFADRDGRRRCIPNGARARRAIRRRSVPSSVPAR